MAPDASMAPASAVTLTLGDAIRLAALNGDVVQAARYLPVQAQARARQARAALLPDLSIQGTDGKRTYNSASLGFSFPTAPGQPPLFDPEGDVLGPVRTIDYRARLALPLLDLGALRRLRSARTLERASTTDVTVATERAAMSAAVAYVQALRAEEECRARGADSSLAAELVRIAEDQLRAGVGIALDVTRARAKLASTRAQLIAARAARDRTRLDLLRALNLPLSTTLALSDSLESPVPNELTVDESAAVARALANRPDLQAAEQRMAAMRQSLGAIRAERLPSLRFVADYGMNGKRYDRLLGTYTYSLVLSASLFDGAHREARLQEEAARLDEAEVRYRALRDQVEAEVRAALLDLASARAQADATREALRLAEQEVAQARDRFQRGVTGNADVITAMLARTDARTALIEALAQVQHARIALAYAEGSVTALR